MASRYNNPNQFWSKAGVINDYEGFVYILF